MPSSLTENIKATPIEDDCEHHVLLIKLGETVGDESTRRRLRFLSDLMQCK